MSQGTACNLLDDAVFRVGGPDGEEVILSLPALFGALAAGKQIEFVGLQAHQTHAWHAFLCQLAAIALDRAGVNSVGDIAETRWHRFLLALTDGNLEPWSLVVEDLSKPAFMQPPVPEGSISRFKNTSEQPDLLDLLVTSKNHDVKRRRVRHPLPEHWVYALVSIQTMEGFGGKNNYGIVRMNGGYGNRACVSVARNDDWSTRFVRDVRLLGEMRVGVTETGSHGYALLWLLPWDGTSSLTLSECHPLCIEVCRRIRLAGTGRSIRARYTGTAKARIDAAETRGNVGDPWIPVRRRDGAGLTAKDLSYRLLQDILFGGDFLPSPASVVRSEDGETPFFIARVLARGQGKTEGFFERVVPCPSGARRLLGSVEGRHRVGSLARQMVDLVATVRNSVLKPAILALLQGGSGKLDFRDVRADRFVVRLDQIVDGVFFSFLFDWVERDPGAALREWAARVLGLAREILDAAVGSVPMSAIRRYRAISVAEAIFVGSARKKFPDNFSDGEGSQDGYFQRAD